MPKLAHARTKYGDPPVRRRHGNGPLQRRDGTREVLLGKLRPSEIEQAHGIGIARRGSRLVQRGESRIHLLTRDERGTVVRQEDRVVRLQIDRRLQRRKRPSDILPLGEQKLSPPMVRRRQVGVETDGDVQLRHRRVDLILFSQGPTEMVMKLRRIGVLLQGVSQMSRCARGIARVHHDASQRDDGLGRARVELRGGLVVTASQVWIALRFMHLAERELRLEIVGIDRHRHLQIGIRACRIALSVVGYASNGKSLRELVIELDCPGRFSDRSPA